MQDVLTEHKRWESVPNRREPITMEMIRYWHRRSIDAHPDSIDAAMFDWMLLGIQAGFRKSEWLQDSHLHSNKKSFSLNRDGTITAFTRSDFTFSQASAATNSTYPNSTSPFSQLHIRWRFQKNGQNGQQVSFNHNYVNEDFSLVSAARRILARADRLGVPDHHPIAVFSDQDVPQHLHHTLIEHHIRSAVRNVYNIRSETTLKLFGCHSVRVGACVLLHAAERDPLFIQFLLRWRSNSFLVYLRNTPRIAAIHNNLVNTINTDELAF